MLCYTTKYKLALRVLSAVLINAFFLSSIPSYAITTSSNDFALAPPLRTAPCEIVYDKKTGKCDVVTNNDVIEAWDRETVRSYEQGVTVSGEAFRNRWAFVDVGILIGQMLMITQKHKLENPKNILKDLIWKHIRNRGGEGEILLEGYDIDGIEEAREGEKITGFVLPVTRNGTPAYRLVYSLKDESGDSDTSIPMKDEAKVYVRVEDTSGESIKAIVLDLSYLRHDVDNALAGFEWGFMFYQEYSGVTPQLQELNDFTYEISNLLAEIHTIGKQPYKLEKFMARLKTVVKRSQTYFTYDRLKAIFEEAYQRLADSYKTTEFKEIFVDLMVSELLRVKNVLSDYSPDFRELPKPVNLNALIDSVRSLKRNIMKVAITEYTAGDIEIVTDEAGLTRALANIILNASEAIDHNDGKGDFKIRTQLTDDKNYVEIVLSDTAGVILPEALPHIFERGFTTKFYERPSERGMGLAIAKEYIETRCGGTISVESEVGKSTTFTIRLPVAPAPSSSQPPASGQAGLAIEVPSAAAQNGRVPPNRMAPDTDTVLNPLDTILKEMPEDTPIYEGVERITRSDHYDEIIKYLSGFENLIKLFEFEHNMFPLFVETRASAEELNRKAAELLADKDFMAIFDLRTPHTTRRLLARAMLASDDVRRSVKAFIQKGDAARVFGRVGGEFISAYLAGRGTREATMALLSRARPEDFARGGRFGLLAPGFGKYYAKLDSSEYGLLTAIWFFLTPTYETLRNRGYTFEEAAEVLAYLCEHFMDKGFNLSSTNYPYAHWVVERQKDIDERMKISENQFKSIANIIKMFPKGIPPAAAFVDKANVLSLRMRDSCRSMMDEIGSLGEKFVGEYSGFVHDYPYLIHSPIHRLYERLLFYAWHSQPWECETQADACRFSFRLHYYTPLLSEWARANTADSIVAALSERGVEINADEKSKLEGALEKVRKGVAELEGMMTEIPPPVYEDEIPITDVMKGILKTCKARVQSDLPDRLALVKGNAVLLRKALADIIEIPPFQSWKDIIVKASASGGEVCITIHAMPSHDDPEVFKIMVDPPRLYSFEGRWYAPESIHFAEAAAVIKAHGGRIEVESEKDKAAIFTIHLPAVPSPSQPPASGQAGQATQLPAPIVIPYVEGYSTGKVPRIIDAVVSDVQTRKIIDGFKEYTGEVYYPCAGSNHQDLINLLSMFPRARRFIFNDKFDQKHIARSIPSPNDIKGIMDYLSDDFYLFANEIGTVKIEAIDKKTIRMTITVENAKTKSMLGRDSIEILYKIDDFRKECGRFGMVYVAFPGLAGRFAELDQFWNDVLSLLQPNGYLVVDTGFTQQPNLSSIVKIAEIEVKDTSDESTGSWVYKVYTREGNVKNVEAIPIAPAVPAEPLLVITPSSERIHATDLQDTLTYIQAKEEERARQAKEEPQPLIVALGTSWIEGYKRNEDGRTFKYLQGQDLNELISSTRTYCESKGIPFIVSDDDKLLGLIEAEKAKNNMAGAKVVVLAGEDTVKSDAFAALRNDEKNAFVVGVNSQELTFDSYIRLMEMLTLALKLSVGLEVSQDSTPIKIMKNEKLHIYIFIPPAQPMNYEELKAIYEVQKFA